MRRRICRRWISVVTSALLLAGGVGCAKTNEEQETDEPIFVELMLKGEENQPVPASLSENPIKNWVYRSCGIDLTLTNTATFEQDVLIRFTANDPPDIICGNYNRTVKSLYESGYLVKDWSIYLSGMESLRAIMQGELTDLLTIDGRLAAVTLGKKEQKYSYKIRMDWLNTLGLSIPTDENELLEVARAFVYNDPDQNGKRDTYAFSSSGYGVSFGDSLEMLQCMWGPNTFYIKDGEISHPMLDGNRKHFLDFVRVLVEEKLIDPDWYTQGDEQREYIVQNEGKVGIDFDTGAIVQNTDITHGTEGKTLSWWKHLSMPAASESGGKMMDVSQLEQVVSVSRVAESDPKKMQAICKLMESCVYPNEGFWELGWGVASDGLQYGEELVALDTKGSYYWHMEESKNYVRKRYVGMKDYGAWIAGKDNYVVSGNRAIDPFGIVERTERLNQYAREQEQYENVIPDIGYDSRDLERVQELSQDFELRYILGEVNDFEAYQQQWLQAGGKNMLSLALRWAKTNNKLESD